MQPEPKLDAEAQSAATDPLTSGAEDVLSDVLRSLRLRGTTYFNAQFASPWGMEIQPGSFANFHLLVRGSCWVQWENHPNVEVRPGDLVVFPHGAGHILRGDPEASIRPAAQLVEVPRSKDPLILGGRGRTTAQMVCGHFEFDSTVRHPLCGSLPDFLHLGSTDGSWTPAVLTLAAAESAGGGPGSQVIVDRLAEILMVQMIRGLVATGQPMGFLAALGDPILSRVLSLIHGHYAEDWTVARLASAVGMSRSTLASRFRKGTDMGVIQYLRYWRLVRAREFLREGRTTVRAAASRVGYDSEWAFAKAYKRAFGQGPGETRRLGA